MRIPCFNPSTICVTIPPDPSSCLIRGIRLLRQPVRSTQLLIALIAWLAVQVSLHASPAPTPEDKKPNEPVLALSGFVGYSPKNSSVRTQCMAPVHIELRAQGQPFNGRIVVRSAREVPIQASVARLSIPVSTGINTVKAFDDLFLIEPNTDSLIAELWAKDRKIQEIHLGITALPRHQPAILALAEDESALSHLANASDPLPTRRRSLIHAVVKNLPRHYLGYESLDAVLVDQASLTDLTDDQVEALKTWVAMGGHLIMAAGGGWQRLDQSKLSALLPVRIIGSAAIDPPPTNPNDMPSTATAAQVFVAESTLKHDAAFAKIVLQDAASGIPLVVQQNIGGGLITFLAFSLVDQQVSRSDGFSRFSHTLFAPIRKPQPLWGDANNSSAIESLLQSKNLLPIPPSRIVGYWLLGYLFIFLPCMFGLARLWRGTGFAWSLMPVAFVGATLFLFQKGRWQVADERSFIQVGTCETTEAGVIAESRSFVSLYSGPEDVLDLHFWSRQGLFLPMNLPNFPGASPVPFHYRTTIDSSPVVQELTIPPRSSRSFRTVHAEEMPAPTTQPSVAIYERTSRMSEESPFQWTILGQQIEGRVANVTAYHLKDAAILGMGRAIPLGEVEIGEEIPYVLSEQTGVRLKEFTHAAFEAPTARETNAAVELAALSRSLLPFTNENPYAVSLVGWTDVMPQYCEAQSQRGLPFVRPEKSTDVTWLIIKDMARARGDIHLEMPDFEVIAWTGKDSVFDWMTRETYIQNNKFDFEEQWTLCLRPRMGFWSREQSLWPIQRAWGSFTTNWQQQLEIFNFARNRWMNAPAAMQGRHILPSAAEVGANAEISGEEIINPANGEVWIRMSGDTYDLTQSQIDLKMNYKTWP